MNHSPRDIRRQQETRMYWHNHIRQQAIARGLLKPPPMPTLADLLRGVNA